MALIKCMECGNAISDRAGKCPSCGAPVKKAKKRTSAFTWMIAAILGGGMLFGLASYTPPTARKSTPAEIKQEAQSRAMASAIRAVKASTKNPDSFHLDNAILIGEDTMCITFHGTNSFNAVVPGQAVIVPSQKVASDSHATWNKFCGGKTGADLSNVNFSS
jgi:hypothetical protein